jgi:hypothetical protein
MPKKKVEKVHLTVTIDVDLDEWLDKMAAELRMNKSQLINNLILMGKDDAEIVKGLGLLGAVKVLRKLREKSSRAKGRRVEIEPGE